MAFQLPDLNYDYNALEPYIDAQTMELHHKKHHNGYVTKLNAAVKDTPAADLSLEDLFAQVSQHPAGVRNNGGGTYNHNLYWSVMAPNSGGKPGGGLLDALNDSFGSFDKFKEQFTQAALTRFGSGWAWLIKADGKLKVTSTPNQDNPLMDVAEEKGTPILAIDVWEHAYYLKYQNRRPDYVDAFWNVINWDEVDRLYKA